MVVNLLQMYLQENLELTLFFEHPSMIGVYPTSRGIPVSTIKFHLEKLHGAVSRLGGFIKIGLNEHRIWNRLAELDDNVSPTIVENIHGITEMLYRQQTRLINYEDLIRSLESILSLPNA